MDKYSLYQARVRGSMGIPKDHFIKNNVSAFKRILARSYYSYTVTNELGLSFKAIITSIPTNPVIEKKKFSTLRENECSLGDIIYWGEDDSYWMLTEQDVTEVAIFQGAMQKCLYKIAWKNPDTNELYESYVAAKGTEETVITDGVKHSIFFDKLTDSLHLIVPEKANGSHLLRRYFQLMINGRKWEIEIADNMSKKDLLYLSLKEVAPDREKDDENFADGKLDTSLSYRSILSELKEIKVGAEYKIDSKLIKLGHTIATDGFIYGCENAELIDGDTILFNSLGKATVKVINEDFNYYKVFTFDVVGEDKEVEQVVKLNAAEKVKTLKNIVTYLDSTDDTEIAVEWKFDEEYFSLVEKKDKSLSLRSKNKTGVTEVKCITNKGNEVTTKVKVVPLMGGR